MKSKPKKIQKIQEIQNPYTKKSINPKNPKCNPKKKSKKSKIRFFWNYKFKNSVKLSFFKENYSAGTQSVDLVILPKIT
jgi:hypothetical protein